MASALAMILSSCGSKQAQTKVETSEEPDSTMFVVLNAHTNDSITFTQIDSKRKRTMGYAFAQKQHAIHGTMTDGDTLAVVPQFKQKRILSSVNYNELVGLWMYESGDGNGMRLDKNGVASTVGNTDNITLREWKLRNGNFILTYIKSEGESYQELADTSTIVSLEDSKFVFTLKGKTHTCYRFDQ